MEGGSEDARHHRGVFIHHPVKQLQREAIPLHLIYFLLFYQLPVASNEVLRSHLHQITLFPTIFLIHLLLVVRTEA